MGNHIFYFISSFKKKILPSLCLVGKKQFIYIHYIFSAPVEAFIQKKRDKPFTISKISLSRSYFVYVYHIERKSV